MPLASNRRVRIEEDHGRRVTESPIPHPASPIRLDLEEVDLGLALRREVRAALVGERAEDVTVIADLAAAAN